MNIVTPSGSGWPPVPRNGHRNEARARSVLVVVTDLSRERPQHLRLLTPEDLARRAELKLVEDKSRLTLGRALLRLAVAHELGVPPQAVVIARHCAICGAPHGKPRITGVVGRPAERASAGMEISLSHSGQLVAVAIARGAAVGIDVEVHRTIEQSVSRLVLGLGETMIHQSDFFTYWCRKESAVKATGDGISLGLTQVSVSRADRPARLLSYAGHPLAARMQDLRVRPGYSGAITVLTRDPVEFKIIDGAALLAE